MAAKEGNLKADARVLLRIYQTNESELIDKIVLRTNNQNKISNRDLKANDSVQVDMEKAFALYGFCYERKANQFKGFVLPAGQRAVSNDIVGQSYLGVVLRRPADARRRKYKIWSELYDQIFTGRHVEPHVLALLIVLRTTDWVQQSGIGSGQDNLRRKVVKNGVYHLARIAAFKWRNTDSWDQDNEGLKASIISIHDSPEALTPVLESSFECLVELINENPTFVNDVDFALKSNSLEREINRKLHSPS